MLESRFFTRKMYYMIYIVWLISLLFLDQSVASTSIIKDLFRDFQLELVTSLPLNDVIFMAIIVKNNFFVGNQKATMIELRTEADKASYFLNNVISCNIEECFIKLLNVMEAYGGRLERLACNIKGKLGISKYIIFIHGTYALCTTFTPQIKGSDCCI